MKSKRGYPLYLAMKKALSDQLIEEIVPLRDDNYRIDDTNISAQSFKITL